MRDDDLRRHMRALDADFDPDPQFADALFTRLTLQSRRTHRGIGRPFVLLAAALTIVALGAGVALGSRILQLPLVADESRSPSPTQQAPSSSSSALASPGESGQPSSTPSSAATQSAGPSTSPPAISLRPGLLPPGSIVTVTGDGLRMRSEPSLSGGIITTLAAGEALIVEPVIAAGPVERDGYEWYQMLYPAESAGSEGVNRGWVAAGQGSQQFVELAQVTCSEDPATIESIKAMRPWERLVCLRGITVTLEGTYGCAACGGSSIGLEPAWLTWHTVLLRTGAGGQPISFHAPPGFELPADGSIVHATLHVDDPAAETCSVSLGSDGTTWTDSQEGPQLFCREQLVIDSIEVLGSDPNWPY